MGPIYVITNKQAQRLLTSLPIGGLSLNVIELTTTSFDEWCHAGKPLAKLRQGENLGDPTLPLGQTLYGCLGDDGVKRATGIREDAIPILCRLMLSSVVEECFQLSALAIFGLKDIT